MRVYLDMCCYKRPYDDQTQLRIAMETQSKLYIQTLIKEKKLKLIVSYMLRNECSQNPFEPASGGTSNRLRRGYK